MLQVTVFEIFAARWSNLGPKFPFWGSLGAPNPKGEKTCPGPLRNVRQNFMPIGATVAEISVTGHR